MQVEKGTFHGNFLNIGSNQMIYLIYRHMNIHIYIYIKTIKYVRKTLQNSDMFWVRNERNKI